MIAKALVLAAGVLIYLGFVQYGHQAAMRELAQIQDFYTAAETQAGAIPTGNYSLTTGNSQAGAGVLSKRAQ